MQKSKQIFHTRYETDKDVFDIDIFETDKNYITRIEGRDVYTTSKDYTDFDVDYFVGKADYYIETFMLSI